MTKKSASDPAADLRRRAEEKAKVNKADIPETLSPEEALRVLQELWVHQIELEMQNEELRRVQAELEASRARYFDLYDLAPVGYFTLSKHGLILEANLTAAGLLGVARGSLVKQPLSRFVVREDQHIFYRHREQLSQTGEPQVCELRVFRTDADPFCARLEGTVARDADGKPVYRVVMSDMTERKQADEALQEALGDIRTLQAIIPICAGCKKVRDDEGSWNEAEAYVRDHSEAKFSHGLCPECMKKLYRKTGEDEYEDAE